MMAFILDFGVLEGVDFPCSNPPKSSEAFFRCIFVVFQIKSVFFKVLFCFDPFLCLSVSVILKYTFFHFSLIGVLTRNFCIFCLFGLLKNPHVLF